MSNLEKKKMKNRITFWPTSKGSVTEVQLQWHEKTFKIHHQGLAFEHKRHDGQK